MTEITQPFAPVPDKSTVSGVEFAKNKKTQAYDFPRRVLVQLPNYARVLFEIGTQEVPEEILNDARSMQWLADNGVKPHVAPVAKLEKLPAITDHHVRFLQQRGYPSVKSVADAIKFVTNLTLSEKVGFFTDASQWEGPKPNDSLGQNKPPVTATSGTANTAGPAFQDDPGTGNSAADSDKPAEDPNAGKSADADDKSADKAAAASASADGDDNSKAAAQGSADAKPSGDAGKSKGKGK